MGGLTLGRLSCQQQQQQSHRGSSRSRSRGKKWTTWRTGHSIANILRNPKKTEFVGLTGPVLLDEEGTRSDFALDVLDKEEALGENRLVVSGWWTPGEGLNYTRAHPTGDEEIKSLDHAKRILGTKKLKIGVVDVSLDRDRFSMCMYVRSCSSCATQDPPFMFKREEHLNKSKDDLALLKHEDLYQGYIIDLIGKLRKRLGFEVEYHLVKSTGTIDEEGHWTGAIKKLVDRVGAFFFY